MRKIPSTEAQESGQRDASRQDAALVALDALAAEVAVKWSANLSAAEAVDEQRPPSRKIPTRSP